MVKVAYTIMNHWEGILRWFDSLIQSAKTKARGYRSHKNFINMAHLVLGRLHLQLPT
jgi:transposase